jgi:transposase
MDFHAQELRIIDAAPRARRAEVLRLMTILGVDATVALSLVAAVGDFRRFGRPERLVSYLGSVPVSATRPFASESSVRAVDRTPCG